MTGNVHLRTDRRFELNDVMKASDTFGNVALTRSLGSGYRITRSPNS